MRHIITPPCLNGARAYVLGARPDSNNIGEHVAERFASAGHVTVMDDGANVNHPQGLLTRSPGQTITPETARQYGYEPTGEGGYFHYSAPSVDEFERQNPDVLVITLGRTYKDHFAEVADYDISNVIRANLVLPLEAARRYVQAVEDIRKEQYGGDHEADGVRHIVFVGSYAHRHPFTNGTLYCASKAGLDMAAKTLGWELTDRGYRVYCVHPYHVQGTPMWSQVERDVMASKDMSWSEADAYNRKDLKMPDLLKPEEVAEIIFTLVENRAMDWLSGTAIELNGGSR